MVKKFNPHITELELSRYRLTEGAGQGSAGRE
jgi:hypothetical protein